MTSRTASKRARGNAKPKVCLVMIVRDEAAIIRERLEAVLPFIDAAYLVDTGSVDETWTLAADTLSGLDNTIEHHDWAGFADARTFALARARDWCEELAEDHPGEWWALLLDADTIFHAAKGWRKILEISRPETGVDHVVCDVHHGTIRYVHPRLLKLGAQEWRWRGVLHEYLEIPAGARGIDCPMIHVEHGSGGARSRDPERYKKDAAMLQAARSRLIPVAPCLTSDDPDADLLPRYTFYEAQSWRDAGYPAAAEAVYEERAAMGGFDQEVYLSWLNVGELRLADGEPQGAVWAWLSAHAADPTRGEALVGLATIAREAQLWASAYLFGWKAYELAYSGRPGGMFADVNVGWRADFEVSVAGWYCGHVYEGRRACERVLASGLAPEAVKERTRANLELYP